MCRMNSAARAWVSSLVSRPRISSTSAMSGTGLKKCMPMKRSARDVAAASAVIEMDEVLVASIASGRMISSACLMMRCLTSRFSVAASITRSIAPRSE